MRVRSSFVLGFDGTAIIRARKLRAETQALRQQTRALVRRVHGANSVIRGIPTPTLMEFAYDLTALSLHDLSRLYGAAAVGRRSVP